MADNTFKNTSDQTFVDGDLVVRPGETVTDINDDRAAQFRGMYSWQFEEAAVGKNAKSEAEIRQETRDYQHPVAPMNNQPQVEVQVEDGNVRVEEPSKGKK
jgi:hypothetical protein